VQSLLRAFGIHDIDVPPTPDGQYALYRTILAHLADSGRPALIILDNVSEPAQAAALLANTLRHRTLITSRDVLESLPARLHRLDELTPTEGAALIRRRRHRGITTLLEELEAATDRTGALHTHGVDQYGRPLALSPVFEISYQRLSPDHARLFRLIAQAPESTCSLSTAAALAGQPESTTTGLLEDLSAHCLVTSMADATTGVGRGTVKRSV
jgi:hypothetical protein